MNRKEELWIRRLLIWIRLRNVVKWHLSKNNFLLMLSWACSMHKAQGRTLDKAVIDLDTAKKCSEMAFIREQYPLGAFLS